jgi:fatty acid desaturase
MNESGNLSRADLYDRLRSQIQHEDNVINIRVVWQLLGQSFFFSTYAAVLNSKGEAKNVLFQQQQELLLWAVPIAALIAGLLASMSIFSSLYTIEHLGTIYDRHTDDKDQSAKSFPSLRGPEKARVWALVPPIGLPILFILIWTIILSRLIAGAL